MNDSSGIACVRCGDDVNVGDEIVATCIGFLEGGEADVEIRHKICPPPLVVTLRGGPLDGLASTWPLPSTLSVPDNWTDDHRSGKYVFTTVDATTATAEWESE